MRRIENLELLTEYGGQKWTRYVDQLEKLKAQVEGEVTTAQSVNVIWHAIGAGLMAVG
jgi:hypothetical protein